MNKQKVNMTSSMKEKGYSSSSHYRISSEFETPYDFFSIFVAVLHLTLECAMKKNSKTNLAEIAEKS